MRATVLMSYFSIATFNGVANICARCLVQPMADTSSSGVILICISLFYAFDIQYRHVKANRALACCNIRRLRISRNYHPANPLRCRY